MEYLTRKKINFKKQVPVFIKNICEKLSNHQIQAFIVGGGIRDYFLGLDPKDWDLASPATPKEIQAFFPNSLMIGERYGTVRVFEQGHAIDISTFRSDGKYINHRHPQNVSFKASISDDLNRRDFTMNAIAYNLQEDVWLDLFSGFEDLQKKCIRSVGDPNKRFSEDALRILRCFRFSAQLGFEVEPETSRAAKHLVASLKYLSQERIGSELEKSFKGTYLKNAFEYWKEWNLGAHILPTKALLMEKGSETCVWVAFLFHFFFQEGLPKTSETLSGWNITKKIKKKTLLFLESIQNIKSNLNVHEILFRLGEHKDEFLECVDFLCERSQLPHKASELRNDFNQIEKEGGPYVTSTLRISGHDILELGIQGEHISKAFSFLLVEIRNGTIQNTVKDLSKKLSEYVQDQK